MNYPHPVHKVFATERHDGAVLQRHGLRKGLSVDAGAVAAAEVLDEDLPVLHMDVRVTPRQVGQLPVVLLFVFIPGERRVGLADEERKLRDDDRLEARLDRFRCQRQGQAPFRTGQRGDLDAIGQGVGETDLVTVT